MDIGRHRPTMLTEGRALLRGEALRRLRWQRQAWVQALSVHAPSTPPLVAPGARAELDASLDLPWGAGEEISPGLSRLGSFVRHRDAAGSASVGDSLAGLMAVIGGLPTQCNRHASDQSMQPTFVD